MKIIRASEICSYRYCQRAWWYQRQGFVGKNQAELSEGSEYHQQHGRAVYLAGCLKTLAVWFLLLALAGVIYWLIGTLIP
jgi:hypothetical protein